MLAALETLTSLEPDYSDDLAAEASVTIIEAADAGAIADVFGDATSRPSRTGLPAEDAPMRLLLNGHEDYSGSVAFFDEEATVEIIEAPLAFEDGDEPRRREASQPASLSERIASVAGRGAGGRFFKALSGG